MTDLNTPASRLERSVTVAYLLWFFLGGLGAHRFYLRRTGSAIGMLVLWLVGVMTSLVFIGYFFLFVWAIWWIIDLFLTAGMVKHFNTLSHSTDAARS